MIDRLRSVAEVATFFGVQRDTACKWSIYFGLPARKIGRGWKSLQIEVNPWFGQQPGRLQAADRYAPSERKREG